MMEKKESQSNYKGFVAGVFSGIAKLSGTPKAPLLITSTSSRLESFGIILQV